MQLLGSFSNFLLLIIWSLVSQVVFYYVNDASYFQIYELSYIG